MMWTIVLIPIFALVAWPIWNIISIGNIINSNAFSETEFVNCQIHSLPCEGEWQCEDFVPVSSTELLFACGNRQGHRKWFPARENFDTDAEENDALFLFNSQSKKVDRVPVVGQPDQDLRLHGIAFDTSLKKVLIVNHQCTGSVIDLYELQRLNGTRLSFVKRFQSPHIVNPNDLTFHNDVGFFVTNDHRFRRGIMRFIEDLFLMRWGSVVYCPLVDPGKCRVVAEGLSFPNGIAISPFSKSQDKLLVAETLGRSVQSYIVTSKNQGKSVALRPSTITELDFMPDNILPTQDGRLFIAGHPQLLTYLASVADEISSPGALEKLAAWLRTRGFIGQYAGSKVVELVPHETEWWLGDRLEVRNIFSDSQGKVEGSSSAVIINNSLYIGTVVGTGGIAECTIRK